MIKFPSPTDLIPKQDMHPIWQGGNAALPAAQIKATNRWVLDPYRSSPVPCRLPDHAGHQLGPHYAQE